MSLKTYILWSLVFQVIGMFAFGQNSSTQKDGISTLTTCNHVDFPEFPNDTKNFHCFLDKMLNKELLKQNNFVGIITANFTVDSLGNISNIAVKHPQNSILDNEILRVLRQMPNWTPGKKNGVATSLNMIIELNFPYKNKFCR